MRVLLISENGCRENLIPFPLGIASVAAAAKQGGHEISCLDLMFADDPVADTIERVRSFAPDCVGLSLRNIDNQDKHSSEFYVPAAKEIADAVRSETGSPIVLGGAGCFGMSIGNESGSEDILVSLRKGFTREEVIAAVSGAKGLGFRINCFLLLGGPGENEETVKESVGLMLELDPDMVGVTAGIRIYPGCEMHDIAIREGVVEPGQNLLYPAFYISRDTEPWLHGHMRDICDAHEGWSL